MYMCMQSGAGEGSLRSVYLLVGVPLKREPRKRKGAFATLGPRPCRASSTSPTIRTAWATRPASERTRT